MDLDHVQVAAYQGCEEEARRFYGEILGMPEIPKQPRGGVWLQCGKHQLHVGIQEDFQPSPKAHPAFLVQNLAVFRKYLGKKRSCGDR